jgi:hypothetical protein
VLPSLQGGLRLVAMQVVGRRDVDDLDTGIVEHRLEAFIRRGQPELAGPCARAIVTRTDDAVNLDAKAPERFDVDDADESSANDGGSDFGDGLHGSIVSGL